MDKIIKDPYQWELSYSLSFENGKYEGGIVASPFENQAGALAYRNVFLDALEGKCKILGIKTHYKKDEITQVCGGSECADENFMAPVPAATEFLASALEHWMRVANTELCHEEAIEDGYAIKRNPNAPS